MARGDYLREVLAAGVCPRCEKRRSDIDEQYSFGVYAGVMCRRCALSDFRDGCGLDGPQGRAEDLDEPLDGEDW